MVSMKDIASKCGVSVATVSKALNGHSDIGEVTRNRVVQTAKEMGYFPNSSARALKTNRTYNLGVLFVDESRNGLTHAYFSSVLDSFKVTAESNGYDITFINCSRDKKNPMSYLEHCKYRGVDGVVIACVAFDDPEVQELIASDVPIVTIDYTSDRRISVVSDNVKGIKDLVTYVYGMGHRRIAYIHGNSTAVTQNRLRSFYRTLEELGASVEDRYVKNGAYRNPEICAKLTKELLELDNPPTCILYPDDYACIGGINAIKEVGLSIPEDISVAGYDGIDIARVLEPKITTLEQNSSEIGKIAAERLIGLIEKPNTAVIERISVEGKVLEGNSVGKLNA